MKLDTTYEAIQARQWPVSTQALENERGHDGKGDIFFPFRGILGTEVNLGLQLCSSWESSSLMTEAKSDFFV